MATFKDRIEILYDSARDGDYRIGREDFANKSGITVGQCSGYLVGQGTKFCETLKTIAANNNTTVSWLVGESDNFMRNEQGFFDGLNPKEIRKIKEYANYLRYLREKENIEQ